VPQAYSYQTHIIRIETKLNCIVTILLSPEALITKHIISPSEAVSLSMMTLTPAGQMIRDGYNDNPLKMDRVELGLTCMQTSQTSSMLLVDTNSIPEVK